MKKVQKAPVYETQIHLNLCTTDVVKAAYINSMPVAMNVCKV